MKIKTVRKQLIDMGFKDGDKIKIENWEYNPYKIDFENNELLNANNYPECLEDLADYEFEKYTPTKEEILKELKKRSKKFKKAKQNYRILYDFELQMVTWSVTYYCFDLSGLIFTQEEAEQICDELNADKEKVKILFDLEE